MTIACSCYLIQLATSAGEQPAEPVLFLAQISHVVAIHSSAMADIRKDIVRVCVCVCVFVREAQTYMFLSYIVFIYSDDFRSQRH